MNAALDVVAALGEMRPTVAVNGNDHGVWECGDYPEAAASMSTVGPPMSVMFFSVIVASPDHIRVFGCLWRSCGPHLGNKPRARRILLPSA